MRATAFWGIIVVLTIAGTVRATEEIVTAYVVAKTR